MELFGCGIVYALNEGVFVRLKAQYWQRHYDNELPKKNNRINWLYAMARENVSEMGTFGNSGSQVVSGNLLSPRPELQEPLSALMDDEASAFEIRRITKALPASPQLLAQWRRYHTVHASLQGNVHQRPSVDLLPAIRAALATGQAVAVPAGSMTGRVWQAWLIRRAGQFAIAASVAAAVLVGLPALQVGQQAAATGPVMAVSGQAGGNVEDLPSLNGDFNESALTRTVSLDPAARGRLEKAVRNFSGTAAVVNPGSTPMFRTPLQPFTVTPVVAPATPPATAQPDR